jgi:hypothetical protein
MVCAMAEDTTLKAIANGRYMAECIVGYRGRGSSHMEPSSRCHRYTLYNLEIMTGEKVYRSHALHLLITGASLGCSMLTPVVAEVAGAGKDRELEG